jgi:hypothetical protein
MRHDERRNVAVRKHLSYRTQNLTSSTSRKRPRSIVKNELEHSRSEQVRLSFRAAITRSFATTASADSIGASGSPAKSGATAGAVAGGCTSPTRCRFLYRQLLPYGLNGPSIWIVLRLEKTHIAVYSLYSAEISCKAPACLRWVLPRASHRVSRIVAAIALDGPEVSRLPNTKS